MNITFFVELPSTAEIVTLSPGFTMKQLEALAAEEISTTENSCEALASRFFSSFIVRSTLTEVPTLAGAVRTISPVLLSFSTVAVALQPLLAETVGVTFVVAPPTVKGIETLPPALTETDLISDDIVKVKGSDSVTFTIVVAVVSLLFTGSFTLRVTVTAEPSEKDGALKVTSP